jgi:hypothetical protein
VVVDEDASSSEYVLVVPTERIEKAASELAESFQQSADACSSPLDSMVSSISSFLEENRAAR